MDSGNTVPNQLRNRVKRASYEVSPNDSKAAMQRFSAACFACTAKVDFHKLGNTLVAIVGLFLDDVDRFKDIAKPVFMKYVPPTIFDGHGTLVAIYASPEDEVEDKWTEHALSVRKREEERVSKGMEQLENPDCCQKCEVHKQ